MSSAIDTKYAQLFQANPWIGNPKTAEQVCPDGVGRYRHYEAASIYWSPTTGAHLVYGLIRAKWAALGWEKSPLGYPTTDELNAGSGKGRFNNFQNNSAIIWKQGAKEAFAVYGYIYGKWREQNWDKGDLGFPITDRLGTPDKVGLFNHFEGGSVYWTRKTGSHIVKGAIRDAWASQGWERGKLRYPRTDELVTEGTNGKGKHNIFEGGEIHRTPEGGAKVTFYESQINQLINSIICTPQQVRPGESVKVEVILPSFVPRGITISINGVPGSVQYLQFATEGKRKIFATVSSGSFVETKEVEINVVGLPLVFKRFSNSQNASLALLRVAQSMRSPYEVTFSIGQSQRGLELATSSTVKSAKVTHVPKNTSKRLSRFKFVTKTAVAITDDPFKSTSPRYQWEFGDGTTQTTAEPFVTHDYFPAIDANSLTKQFHVRCRVLDAGIDVTRTLTLHSAYGICKRQGTIVLHTMSDALVEQYLFKHTDITLNRIKLTVHNIEDVPLTITHSALVPLSDNPDDDDSVSPSFSKLNPPLVLSPKSSVVVDVILDISKLSSKLPFLYEAVIYYAGNSKTGTPVRFSAIFQVPPPHSSKPQLPEEKTEKPPTLEEIVTNIGKEIINPGDVLVNQGSIHMTPNLGMLATVVNGNGKQLPDKATIQNVQDSMQKGLGRLQVAKVLTPISAAMSVKRLRASTSIDPSLSSLTNTPIMNFGPPPPPKPGTVSEGQVCDPYNISDGDEQIANEQQLSCQTTDEEIPVVGMPGRFVNARKGEIILSPGGIGLIGTLLKQVTPSQLYSHCGIMTRNYDEITHSTASIARLRDYPTNMVPGLPIEKVEELKKKPLDGYRPDVLKYMWPGVVTQPVEAAVNGEGWVDPENKKTYPISSFSAHAVGTTDNDQFVVVPPLVVKPDPFKETPAIRQKLNSIAADARAVGGRLATEGDPGQPIKSHYRLFCYTDPTIGLTTVAGAKAGWAQGTFPSVCSSFIWTILKKRNIHLEADTAQVMPTDLELSDIAKGAEVLPGTPDGLYAYTAAERLAAAEWLFNTIHYQAFDEAGWLGDLVTDAADDVANQIVNVFASDDANGKDSEAWKSIKAAIAVSPDNILLWDSPDAKGLYGYVEPLQYREPRNETYTIRRWKHYLNRGTITGTITRDGAPADGAKVQVGNWLSVTDVQGRYTLTDVGLGSYEVKADQSVDGIFWEAKKKVKHYTPSTTVDLALQPPADSNRLVDIFLNFHGVDDDYNDDPHDQTDFFQLELGASKPSNSKSVPSYKWGGEVRAEFIVFVALLDDKSINVTVEGKFFEGTGEENNDLEDHKVTLPINVLKDQTATGSIKLDNDEFLSDDFAILTFQVKNGKNTN